MEIAQSRGDRKVQSLLAHEVFDISSSCELPLYIQLCLLLQKKEYFKPFAAKVLLMVANLI